VSAPSPAGERRVAVVTGGARGLGRGAVARLLDDGFRVAIVDTLESIDGADGLSGEWSLHVGDVSDAAFVRSVAADVIERWGRVDGLVNNAGIFPRGGARDLPEDEWHRVLTVNLTGTFLCSQVFGALMLDAGAGAIVNTASGQAFRPAANTAAYSASKGGVVALTRALAMEWAPTVRVNCIVPGMADTAMPRIARSEESFQAAASKIPMGRAATARDTGAAVSFLLSDDAAYITGQTLGINCGAVLI
jgi:NAD(P)-dependent dehydrogenase (short-subunit alcohol dehydrogenase family)